MKEEGKRKKRRAQVSHKGGSGERNQPEREEDRSRWRGWCPEPTLCPVPCSLALYAAPHPTPGSRQRGGKQGRGGAGGEDTRQGRHHAHGTGDRWTRDTQRTPGTRHLTRRNKTKTKRKSRLVSVLSLGSGHRLEGGGQGVRQDERVDLGSRFSKGQVDFLLSSRMPPTSLFSIPSMEQEGASLGPGDFNPVAPYLTRPHGQHDLIPGPFSSHGHLLLPGFGSDPASLNPRVIFLSIGASLGRSFFHHTPLSNPLPREPLRIFYSCPKLLGATEKSLR